MAIVSRQYEPPPPLSSFVKCFWYWEGAPQTHSKERLMPNGEPSIVLNLRDNPIQLYDPDNLGRSRSYGHAVVSGAHTNCMVIDTLQQDRVFGIQFRAGGAFPFIRMPACELENTSVTLNYLWPRANELRERLLAAPTTDAMFPIAEGFLLAQLVRSLTLHPAVNFACRQFCARPHDVTAASILDQTGLSQRRFIQLFHEQIGVTPKAFCRVRRFQRILESVHRASEVNWVRVALDCGYYDQAHFIHDFRQFSGLTPTQYWEHATTHLNHVPIL
ncbi:MAG: helix-turn-helix domain-containing protein [Candidatus Acidiferrum sp.]